MSIDCSFRNFLFSVALLKVLHNECRLALAWYIWSMTKALDIPVIGILGGGQLGRMFIQNALRYNAEIHVLDPDASAPCAQIASRFVQGAFSDYDTVMEFGRSVDVLTIEIEHVNTDALFDLQEDGVQVFPQPEVLSMIQHKGRQKEFYQSNGIPTSAFVHVESRAELEALDSSWFPCFQKLFTSGYDGKGVVKLESVADIDKAFDAPSVVEKCVDLEQEFAVIVSGHASGELAVFPVVDMIFHPVANLVEFLSSPSALPESVQQTGINLAKQIAQLTGIRGLLAVEFFLDREGKVWVNEMAPRPHNSGHHTIQGNLTSQFEQHFRAICGWSPGSTEAVRHAVMLNLLGEPGYDGIARYEGLREVSAWEGVNVQLYGKRNTKPFRKMGHVTVLAGNTEKAMEYARRVQKTLKVIS